MKDRESGEDSEKVQYISNRSSRFRSNGENRKRGKIFLKEMKVENFLEVMKYINHELNSKKNKHRKLLGDKFTKAHAAKLE